MKGFYENERTVDLYSLVIFHRNRRSRMDSRIEYERSPLDFEVVGLHLECVKLLQLLDWDEVFVSARFESGLFQR